MSPKSKSKQKTEGLMKQFGKDNSSKEILTNWASSTLKGNENFGLRNSLIRIFNEQEGIDGNLKCFEVRHVHFPKWDQQLIQNCTGALMEYEIQYKEIDVPPPNDDPQKPSGTTDEYLQDSSTVKNAMPFIIVDDESISDEDCALAALSGIYDDDELAELFNWENSPNNQSDWDGFTKLGLEGDMDDCLKKAQKKWFLQSQYNSEKRYTYLFSENFVKKINWILSKQNKGISFNVKRFDEIKERMRSNDWVTPQSLKTFRLDWPINRNLEEAANLLSENQTSVISNLIEKYCAKYTSDKLMKDYHDILNAPVEYNDPDNPEYGYYEPEPYEVQEYLEGKYKRYRNVLSTFNHDCPVLFSEEKKVESATNQLTELFMLQKKLATQYNNLKDDSPELFEKAEELTKKRIKGGLSLSINCITEDKNNDALDHIRKIQLAMSDPILGFKTLPEIVSLHIGEITTRRYEAPNYPADGPNLPPVIHTIQFVVYRMNFEHEFLDDPKSTDDKHITKNAIKIYRDHFKDKFATEFGENPITPKLIKFLHELFSEKHVGQNFDYIFPDPRVLNMNSIKDLMDKYSTQEEYEVFK